MNFMRTIIVTTIFALTSSLYAQGQSAQRIIDFDETLEAVERMKGDIADLMAMDEQVMLAVVPAQSGIYFTDCPNCDKSAQDHGNFDWSPLDPHHIVCRDCGEKYPDNSKYPETGALEVRSINGTHAYPYYQRDDGYRIYFRARADDLAREYMAARCTDFARLWWITRDEQYARRAALILMRFAEVYPGYALHYDYPFTQKKIVPYDSGPIPEAMQHADGPTRTAKWTMWANMDISEELTAAYDLLRLWPPLPTKDDGRTVEGIERDLLGAMVDYTMGLGEAYDNMSPHKWRTAIEAARVLNQPEVIHDAVGRLEHFLDGSLLYDGSWMETSPSYMAQVAGNLEVIETALRGYVDPPGYAHPQTGRRLSAENVTDLLAKRRRIIDHLVETRLPDGRWIPLNDTWSSDRRAARESTASVLSPGFGVAVLGGGTGDAQYHTYLNFTSGTGHKHSDALSIGLWAHGHELLGDIGYTHTAYRYWTISTASHNTVLVDGVDQGEDVDHSGNRLRAFATDGRGFHLAEAEATNVYPQTSRYRRTLIAVGKDPDEAYLVDVFQVHGGGQHDYILVGNADEDGIVSAPDLTFEPYQRTLLNEGVTFTKPTEENDLSRPQTGLGFIRDLKHAAVNGCTAVDFRLAGSPSVGTRTWLDAGADTNVYLGQAPSIRRSQRRDATLDDFLMPVLVARRSGDDLRSTFVAVHEPVNGDPRVRNVQVQRHESFIVVTVTSGDVTDYLLVGLGGPVVANIETPHGRLQLDGRYAMARVLGNRPTESHLVGGARLSFGDMQLRATDAYRGTVRQARGRDEAAGGVIEVDELIPADTPHSVLLLRYADGTTQGFNVVRIEPSANSGIRILVREDPGFETIDGAVKLTHYPQRTIEGDHVNYELFTSVHYIADDSPE